MGPWGDGPPCGGPVGEELATSWLDADVKAVASEAWPRMAGVEVASAVTHGGGPFPQEGVPVTPAGGS